MMLLILESMIPLVGLLVVMTFSLGTAVSAAAWVTGDQ